MSRSIVFIEPHAALFRYLDVARDRFRILVLTADSAACREEERGVQSELGKPGDSWIDCSIECDTTSVDQMLEALAPFYREIAGILAGDDPFVPVAAQLGTRLGFDYSSAEDALAQQRKSRMKERLHQHGVRTAAFEVVTTFEDARRAWQSFGSDAVIKMVDYLGSLNVSRVNAETELRSAWENIIEDRHHAPTPFPLAKEALIEAFIPGRELSIEGYVQGDRCVVLNYNDKITERHFLVIGHHLPASVTQAESEALEAIAKECTRALGLRNTVFHMEVNLHDGAPWVIESASRPPGQYMVDLMQRSYGIDLMDISIRLATGEIVTDTARSPRRHFAMLALYAEQTGVFNGMQSWDEFLARPGVLRTFLGIRPGDPVTQLETFQDKYGFVILESDTASGVRDETRWFFENVRMQVLAQKPAIAFEAAPSG